MEIGTPLPADLAQITNDAVQQRHSPDAEEQLIRRLHAEHHAYDGEIAELHAKQIVIKRVLDALYRNRTRRTMAGFTQSIGGR